jgi:hypothetical protein
LNESEFEDDLHEQKMGDGKNPFYQEDAGAGRFVARFADLERKGCDSLEECKREKQVPHAV